MTADTRVKADRGRKRKGQAEVSLTPAGPAKAAAVQKALKDRLEAIGLGDIGVRVWEKIEVEAGDWRAAVVGRYFKRSIAIVEEFCELRASVSDVDPSDTGNRLLRSW